jgi:adenosylcobyric acid synthase
MLQERAFGVPTLGIIPLVPDLRIANEDAVWLEDQASSGISAGDQKGTLEIAVIHLPHIANFDEFDALAAEPGVRLRYVQHVQEFGHADAVIIPGTKATLDDLAWLYAQQLDRCIHASAAGGAAVVGICGGYQMLGQHVSDPFGVEGMAGSHAIGLGLLPVVTEFAASKQTYQSRLQLASGQVVTGYEIHMGTTMHAGDSAPLGTIIARGDAPVAIADGARDESGLIWGTYLHGIFEDTAFRRSWLAQLGWNGGDTQELMRQEEYDRLADAVEEAVDWELLARLTGISVMAEIAGG